MSLSIKAERTLVMHDEFEMLAQTHHPALHSISDDALSDAQRRIRDLRAKERTFARDLRRSIRGGELPTVTEITTHRVAQSAKFSDEPPALG
ncbi:UNVERIFIED_ORG: hypothetical protein J2W74_003420 [Methylorubrum zatmanii]